MTSLRQIEANRRNARLSTGPVTEEGKKKSRRNALRHGLAAETVIDALEDAEDYAAFELAVTADFDAQSAVERELVLRLASLLWRLRRVTAIEAGLFKEQVRQLVPFRGGRPTHRERKSVIDSLRRNAVEEITNGRIKSSPTMDRTGIYRRLQAKPINSPGSRGPLSAYPVYQVTRLTGSIGISRPLAAGLPSPVHTAVSRPPQTVGGLGPGQAAVT